MKSETFHADQLVRLLRKRKIATMDQLKQALGTHVEMTVFRKLKQLDYLSSYSHRGKYYTLAEIPEFDEDGLWLCRSVAFSRFGNLVQTARHFVEQAPAGFAAAELQSLLHVEVKQCLLQLVRQDQLKREKIGGQFVYWTPDKQHRTGQKRQRKQAQAAGEIGFCPLRKELSPELNAAVILFCSLLNEKQRRLYAGLESFKQGHGGDRKVADFLGLDVHTVARGRRQLFSGDVAQEGIRRKGAGRQRVEKNAASNRRDCPTAGTRHGRRPDQRFEVDAEDDRKSRRPIEAVEDRGQSEHGRSVIERHGVFVARQSQEGGIGKQEPSCTPGPRQPVRIYQPDA